MPFLFALNIPGDDGNSQISIGGQRPLSQAHKRAHKQANEQADNTTNRRICA